MNVLPVETYERIRALTLEGKSVRQIVAQVGHSQACVRNYRDMTLLEVPDMKCACGKPIKHQGWCANRLKRSPSRQQFLTRWRRHSKINWVWKVLLRISRGRWVAKEDVVSALVRLAHKHSAHPNVTIRQLLKLTWFDASVTGIKDGEATSNEFAEAWAREPCHPESLCWIEQRRDCAICRDRYAFVEYSDGPNHATCGNEWCERFYTFYYVEGRYRPPTVRGGKNNGLRFEFFLSDYVRRTANERSKTGT